MRSRQARHSPLLALTTRTPRRPAVGLASRSPTAVTVRTNPLIMTFDDIQLFLHVERLPNRVIPPPPAILLASELTPELDLVGAALSRDSPASEEVVSLTSGKSGLRLGFATNRASDSLDAGVSLPLLSYSYPTRRGYPTRLRSRTSRRATRCTFPVFLELPHHKATH